MQIRPLHIEPRLRARHVGAQPVHQPPEARPVIHLDQMRDLMRDHVVEDPFRGEDQPPGEGKRAGRGGCAARLTGGNECAATAMLDAEVTGPAYSIVCKR